MGLESHAGGLRKLIKNCDINSGVLLKKRHLENSTFLKGDLKIQNFSDRWLGLRLKDH